MREQTMDFYEIKQRILNLKDIEFNRFPLSERKPRNMVFKFCLEISNSLRSLSFFNQKLKTVPERGFRSGTTYVTGHAYVS